MSGTEPGLAALKGPKLRMYGPGPGQATLNGPKLGMDGPTRRVIRPALKKGMN
jgi:hypothetical protein